MRVRFPFLVRDMRASHAWMHEKDFEQVRARDRANGGDRSADSGVAYKLRREGEIPAAREASPAAPVQIPTPGAQPTAGGKFLFVGDEKLYVRGVTYGTFRPRADGSEYPEPEVVEEDFRQIATNGMNAVRTYTVPPRWLLDTAQEAGLFVMVGLPWEQHVTFLDERKRAQSIEQRIREGVRACAGHPAVLCYAVGNEIPAPVVRWHGRRRVERFIRRLYDAAKSEDPAGLVTYVNYPTTEYLELPFLDLVCFNVFLEGKATLEAYLARVQNLVGERPLVMAEMGLDSRRHGEAAQADVLRWQIQTAFEAGCAGAFVFSWTDEWHRGGHDIDDWDFGLTDRARFPKPALGSVRTAFESVPVPVDAVSPRVSVVVCTLNGEPTLRDCLEGLSELDYPDYEVIVVDDGSTDDTAAIARDYDVRVISTENQGLASARNIGLHAATGEIVAYIDDDARPDRHWLTYLVSTFQRSSHVAVGGPNIPPPGDGSLAECVANSPGNPAHVLVSDREAEHIPGCNSAFRKWALDTIGGWDPQYRVAGDDVDVCWRLRDRGWTIGYTPAAVVWHHRRKSLRAYWCHQRGYGKAEALLERKWPEKYNGLGHLTWGGRMYQRGLTTALYRGRRRVAHGTWGSAPFQSIYEPAQGLLPSLVLMPEWYLVLAALAAVGALGALWQPLLFALPLLALATVAVVGQAWLSASKTDFRHSADTRWGFFKLRFVTALLHLLQPAARLRGRIAHGLTPWRRRGPGGYALPLPRVHRAWHESWRSPEDRLQSIESKLRDTGAAVRRGGDYDRWDLEVRAGLMGGARLRSVVEEHGGGKQLMRARAWPRPSAKGAVLALLSFALAAGAAVDGAWAAAVVLGLAAVALATRMVGDSSAALATLGWAVTEPEPEPERADPGVAEPSAEQA